jgi:hypothetical protein
MADDAGIVRTMSIGLRDYGDQLIQDIKDDCGLKEDYELFNVFIKTFDEIVKAKKAGLDIVTINQSMEIQHIFEDKILDTVAQRAQAIRDRLAKYDKIFPPGPLG